MPATKLCLGATSICEMLYLHASHDFGIALPFSGYDIMLLNSKAKQGQKASKSGNVLLEYHQHFYCIARKRANLGDFTSETE